MQSYFEIICNNCDKVKVELRSTFANKKKDAKYSVGLIKYVFKTQ